MKLDCSLDDSDVEDPEEILRDILNQFDPVFDEQKSIYYKHISKCMSSKGSNYYIFESGLMSLISKRMHNNPYIDNYKI